MFTFNNYLLNARYCFICEPCLPQNWTDNNKWALHGDMIRQFAGCVAAANVARGGRTDVEATNVSVYMDVWASLNGRFHQRMIDPSADILHDPWTPWTPVPWLLPLLHHFDRWRPTIADSKNEMDHRDGQLLFFADFPGLLLGFRSCDSTIYT